MGLFRKKEEIKKEEEKVWSIYTYNNELVEKLTRADYGAKYVNISVISGDKSLMKRSQVLDAIRHFVMSLDDLSKCKKIPDNCHRIVSDFNVPFIKTSDGNWYFIEDGEKQLEEILKDHKPFVIKGTDWPYYFNVNGSIVESETSNYWLYLRGRYNYLDEHLLEEYTGEDKYFEHKK